MNKLCRFQEKNCVIEKRTSNCIFQPFCKEIARLVAVIERLGDEEDMVDDERYRSAIEKPVSNTPETTGYEDE